MLFQVISDLHLECRENQENYLSPLKYLTPTAKILILAGDIGSAYKMEQLTTFIKGCCTYFSYVIYVAGNHEYYRVNNQPEIPMEELENRMKNLEKECNNLFVLIRNVICIKDIYICGCTLWSYTDIDPYIVKIGSLAKKAEYNKLYQKEKNFIRSVISTAKQHRKRLLIISHHAPSKKSTFATQDRFSKLYYSDLDYMIKKENMDTWIHGHTHNNVDYVLNGTRIFTNQLGKIKDQQRDFRKNAVVEIK